MSYQGTSSVSDVMVSNVSLPKMSLFLANSSEALLTTYKSLREAGKSVALLTSPSLGLNSSGLTSNPKNFLAASIHALRSGLSRILFLRRGSITPEGVSENLTESFVLLCCACMRRA